MIYLIFLFLGVFLSAQNRPAISTVLQSAPAGDCRQEFYNQVLDEQDIAFFVCNFNTGQWTNAVTNVGIVSGNLPTANLNNGTNASSTTYWEGDGIWNTPSLANLSGNLQISSLAGGMNANTNTFWRGDGTWANPNVPLGSPWSFGTGTVCGSSNPSTIGNGPNIGAFIAGASSCTVTIILGGLTAPNGWVGAAYDITSGQLLSESAYTTTTVTFSNTTGLVQIGDQIIWSVPSGF